MNQAVLLEKFGYPPRFPFTKLGAMTSKNKRPNIIDILEDCERRIPSKSAEKWDNVGHLSGDAGDEYRGAVISIDLTEDAIRTAEATGANLILNHHPAIFPRSRGLTAFTAQGRSALLFQAQRRGISVFSAHTNFDRCALDAMEWLAEELGTKPVGRLTGEDEPPLRKLAVFVPTTHREAVANALFAAGAGQIGRYDSCAFATEGEGTFRAGKGAKPFLGKVGRLERARETRLETVFVGAKSKAVLRALRESHPYEEIAYDLYRLEQPASAANAFISGLGYGFIGEYPKPIAFDAFLRRAYSVFGVDAAMVGLPTPKTVKRIAFSPGKGSSFVTAAADAGCDVFITGETGYHDSREAALRGLTVVEVGHRESEIAFLRTVGRWLKPFGKPVTVLNDPIQRIVSIPGTVKRTVAKGPRLG